MNFIELAASRRSLRKFSDKEVPRDVIDQIITTTMTAPSSKNMRTTRIAVTTDRKIMEIISDMRSTGAAFVKDSPLVFFVMGDDNQTDLWRENCSISATMLQFAAEQLGLGSCWVQVFSRPYRDSEPDGMTAEEYLRKNIPDLPPYRIMCVVAAGWPEGERRPRKENDDSDKVFYL